MTGAMNPQPRPRASFRIGLTTAPGGLVLGAVLLMGLSCNRRRTLCPEGMQQVAVNEAARSIWCEGKNGEARWIERHAQGGARRQSCAFEKGVLSGPFESWHANGSAWIIGSYLGGKKVGRWLQRDPNGGKVAGGAYRNGELIEGAPVGVASLCETVTPLKR